MPPVRMRRVWRRRLVVAAAVAAAVVAALGVNTAGQVFGFLSRTQTPAERSALLSPDYRLVTPDRPGPWPGLVLFSGCDGVRDNMARWADMAAAEGWAALIVDSHAPRGLDDLEVWRLVCSGQTLSGQVRAGDVAVALADLRAIPGIDPDRIVLLGASHGGWAVAEYLAYLAGRRPPPGLADWPGGSPEASAKGLAGAILLYPYCGAGSRVGRTGWASDVPVLMLLARDDGITGDEPCRSLAARLAAEGRPVTEVTLDGVTHGFDQQERSFLSPLVFDPAATTRALEMGRDFLARTGG